MKTIIPIEHAKTALTITKLTATLEDGSTFDVPWGVLPGDVVVQDADGSNRAFLPEADLAEHWQAV